MIFNIKVVNQFIPSMTSPKSHSNNSQILKTLQNQNFSSFKKILQDRAHQSLYCVSITEKSAFIKKILEFLSKLYNLQPATHKKILHSELLLPPL